MFTLSKYLLIIYCNYNIRVTMLYHIFEMKRSSKVTRKIVVKYCWKESAIIFKI